MDFPLYLLFLQEPRFLLQRPWESLAAKAPLEKPATLPPLDQRLPEPPPELRSAVRPGPPVPSPPVKKILRPPREKAANKKMRHADKGDVGDSGDGNGDSKKKKYQITSCKTFQLFIV
jgi:hypothetical protein